MRGYVLLGVLLLSTFISFSQGGWCTSTSLSVDDCSNGTTSSSHSATEFNSSCSGSETSEGFFWLPGAVEGETYDFTTVSPTLASLGISVFGVDGLSCTASTVNEITCSTSAIGINSVTATLSGSQYYYIQVYTTDGSSGSDYTVCMSSTSSSGGGGSGGGGSTGGVLPTEQDCEGAIPVCQYSYDESNAYSGEGNITGEISSTISCMQGEKNDVWYIFTTQTSGNICFDITPNQMSDDYDWAVYDISNSPCSDIATDASLQVSCNWSSSTGITGPNGGSDANDEACIPVGAGETYVVNVSQFSTSSNGYNIDFSSSTADMWDNSPPVFNGVTSPAQGATTLEFNFSENVDCSSIDDSDFTLTGPGGPYTLSNITGDICALGGTYEDIYTADVSPALTTNGTYDLCLVSGSGVISDVCGNQASPACYSFTISSNPACPDIAPIVNTEACETFTLPAITGTDLTGSQAYFTGIGGTGTQYNPGTTYSTPGTVTLYAYDGTTGCDDEETFDLTIISTVFSSVVNDPTSCGGTEGSITITGANLLGSTSYNVGYTLDGLVVAPIAITSNASGEIIIPNLGAGAYTDINIEYNTCASTDAGPYTLSDPNSPTYTALATDPTSCGGTEGYITLSGLTASTSYDVGYTDGGVVVAPTSISSDALGDIVIPVLDAGSYTDIIVTLNGCSTTDAGPYILSDPNGPTFTAVATDPTTCGGTEGYITLSGLTASTSYDVGYTDDGVVVAPTSISSDALGDIVIPVLDAGSYTDIVVILNGCSTTDAGPYTLVDPNGPTFTVASNDPTTCSGTDGSLIIGGLTVSTAFNVSYIVDGTLVPATSMTSDVSGDIIIGSLVAGVYTDLEVELNGCSTVAAGPFTLTGPTVPTFTVTANSPTVCLGTDGSLVLAGLSATTSYDVDYTVGVTPTGSSSMISDASGEITISTLGAETYSDVTVVLSGCSTVLNGPYTLTDPAGPVFTTTGTNPNSCGASDGSILISDLFNSTTYDISYSVNGTPLAATSLTSSASGEITISTLSAGTYSDIIVDLGGCATTDAGPISLSDPGSPVFTTSSSNPTTCSGTEGTITLSGLTASTTYNVNYSLNGIPVGLSAMTSNVSGEITISTLSAGTYSDIIVELLGCSGTANAPIVLIDPALPVFTVLYTDPTTCSGSEGTLTISGLNASTSYNIEYSLAGTAVGVSVMTTDGSGVITITNLSAGAYTDVSVELSGCTTTDAGPFNLTDPNAPSFTVVPTDPTTCTGTDGNLVLSGLTANTAYLLDYAVDGTSATQASLTSSASGEIILQSLGAGTYTGVTVALSGCSTTDVGTYTLIDPGVPTPAITAASIDFCGGALGSVNINSLLASTSYNVTYDDGITTVGPNSLTSDATGLISITGLVGGNYNLQIVDAVSLCSSAGTASVIDNRTTPTADAGFTLEVNCFDPSPNLIASGSIGANFAYSWSTTNGTIVLDGAETSLTPTISSGGAYTLRVTDNNNNCYAEDDVVITENLIAPTADAGLGQVLSCLNPIATIDGSASGASGTITYAWSTLDGLILGAGNTNSDFAILAGTYTITVFDANNGCSSTDDVEITGDLTAPNLLTLPVDPICESAAIIDLGNYVNISGGTWTGTGMSNPSSVFDVSVGPGSYSISYEVTDPINFCTSTETIDVVVNPNPVLIINAQTLACVGDSIKVSVDGADSFIWSNGANVDEFYHQVLPGTAFYSVVGTDATTGCIASTNVSVEGVNSSVSLIGLTPQNSYPYFAELGAIGTDVDNYEWISNGNVIGNGADLNYLFGQGQHIVSLVGEDSNSGCTDTMQLVFELLDPANIFVPTGFSPNGDGHNDVFTVGATFVDCQMLIFNRWGELVYSDKAATPSWDGKDLSGNICQEDVYIYKIVATFSNEEEYERIGQVTLIR